MSRDPNDPNVRDEIGKPIDPTTLHKYLYAGGELANMIDLTGRDIIEDTFVLERKSLSAVEYLNTVGCFANILFTASSTILSENLDLSTLAGVGGTAYGCLTISLEPEGRIFQAAKTALDLGVCALGAASTIHDLNEYIDDPTAANEAKVVADDLGSVLGCGLTGLGAALGH